MNSKHLFVFILACLCLIETVLGAAGRCYQCDSRNPNCGFNSNPAALGDYRVPCNGQCYYRIRGNEMSRGCSWEHGFMTSQTPFSLIHTKDAAWIFCDTPLCNVGPSGPA